MKTLLARRRLISTIFATALLLPLYALDAQVASRTGDEHAEPASRRIEVEPGVKLEVLDWGGKGKPVLLIPGLGATAHSFDGFAPELAKQFHVYSLTRRGYGASSVPAPTSDNYSAQRLGEDVVAVIEALKIQRPILIGHSFAGEELSWVGSMEPAKIAGLVYLDAGYRYALSGPGLNDLQIDALTMRRYLADAMNHVDPVRAKQAADTFLQELPDFQQELQKYSNALGKAPSPTSAEIAKEEAERRTPQGAAEQAILNGERRFSDIKCPMLVIFAYPHRLSDSVQGDARTKREKADMQFVDQRVALFRALPNSKVVLLPHAAHAVQDSNRDEVVAQILEFADSLHVTSH
ncbi:MAG: alpha/beta fold hydrolase [Terriglobia bacterium]